MKIELFPFSYFPRKTTCLSHCFEILTPEKLKNKLFLALTINCSFKKYPQDLTIFHGCGRHSD